MLCSLLSISTSYGWPTPLVIGATCTYEGSYYLPPTELSTWTHALYVGNPLTRAPCIECTQHRYICLVPGRRHRSGHLAGGLHQLQCPPLIWPFMGLSVNTRKTHLRWPNLVFHTFIHLRLHGLDRVILRSTGDGVLV